jgi:hypothetical protein
MMWWIVRQRWFADGRFLGNGFYAVFWDLFLHRLWKSCVAKIMSSPRVERRKRAVKTGDSRREGLTRDCDISSNGLSETRGFYPGEPMHLQADPAAAWRLHSCNWGSQPVLSYRSETDRYPAAHHERPGHSRNCQISRWLAGEPPPEGSVSFRATFSTRFGGRVDSSVVECSDLRLSGRLPSSRPAWLISTVENRHSRRRRFIEEIA